MIFVIDSDAAMRMCLARAVAKAGGEVREFSNAIEAMDAIEEAPELILMEVMLDGPDGFTFLNELASYKDTMQTPVVIVTEAAVISRLTAAELASYGVVGVLDKDTLTPEEIMKYVQKYRRD